MIFITPDKKYCLYPGIPEQFNNQHTIFPSIFMDK